MIGHLLLTVFIFEALSTCNGATRCADCEGIQAIENCVNHRTCQTDEICFAKQVQRGSELYFSLGCQAKQLCGHVPLVVGRAANSSGHALCDECCSTYNLCNLDLCTSGQSLTSTTEITTTTAAAITTVVTTKATAAPTAGQVITVQPGQCADDPNFNCQLVSSTFNICGDIQHAKLVCRKWCNLCDLVDGGWSEWSPWSGCDVSCGSGHVIRRRSCTNPAPNKGGLDCQGSSEESIVCTSASCPVNGGWGGWGLWSGCSKTCGVGIRSRDRNCSNPEPELGGRDCQGDPANYDTCFHGACANGGWTDWSEWSTCSATCDGGLRSRLRACNNPPPSEFGKDCPGDGSEYTACNVQSCQGQNVFFAVNSPTGTLLPHGIPIFNKTISNNGDAYNSSSGCFESPEAGLYIFHMSLLADNHTSSYCYIQQNGENQAYVQATATTGLQSGSTSIVLALVPGDKVCPACGNWGSVHHSMSTSFMGALLRQ